MHIQGEKTSLLYFDLLLLFLPRPFPEGNGRGQHAVIKLVGWWDDGGDDGGDD